MFGRFLVRFGGWFRLLWTYGQQACRWFFTAGKEIKLAHVLLVFGQRSSRHHHYGNYVLPFAQEPRPDTKTVSSGFVFFFSLAANPN